MPIAGGADNHRAATSAGFAIGAAQRHLFGEAFDFRLKSRDSPGLQVRIRIEPLATSGRGATIAGHRRTLTMFRDGQQTVNVSSISRIDLSTRTLIAVEVEGLHAEVRNAASLPRIATIGDSGHYFDHLVRPAGVPAAPLVPSTINWALEPWDHDHAAVWCLHVVHPSGSGIVSTEGYVIDPDGRIVGAVLRAKVPPGRATGGDAAGGSRLVELRSVEDA